MHHNGIVDNRNIERTINIVASRYGVPTGHLDAVGVRVAANFGHVVDVAILNRHVLVHIKAIFAAMDVSAAHRNIGFGNGGVVRVATADFGVFYEQPVSVANGAVIFTQDCPWAAGAGDFGFSDDNSIGARADINAPADILIFDNSATCRNIDIAINDS